MMKRGAALIVGVEFWERFSYYGMLAIFVLFLTDSTENGGFGWSQSTALGFLGVYTALSYGTPMIGGVLADRFLGTTRAIILGSVIMTLGHFFLAGPAIAPGLIAGADAGAILEQSGVVLGQLFPNAETKQMLAEAASTSGLSEASLMAAYQTVSLSFYAGVVGLVLGNLLMKASLTVKLGDQFPNDPVGRDKAFTYYYLAISVGALMAGLIVGTVGERISWHLGFSIAGVGMSIAAFSFILLYRRLLLPASNTVQTKPSVGRVTEDIDDPKTGDPRLVQRLVIVAVMAVFLAIFMAGWFQIFGSWVLFTRETIDRTLFSFEIPISWFISINAIVVIAVTPLLAMLWARLDARRITVDFPTKLAFALGIGALGHAVLTLAAASGWGSFAVPAAAIVAISIAEPLAWTPSFGFVYSTAPRKYAATLMGLFFFVSLSLSGFLAGQLGQLSQSIGYASFFMLVTAGTVIAAIALLLMRPILSVQNK